MGNLADLASWPPLALIAFGITFAVVSAIVKVGVNAGRSSAPVNSPAAAQVATIIVDPTALNNATAAVRDLTEAMTDGQSQEADHAHMICRRLEGVAGEIKGLTAAVTALMVEMARKG